jgi:hypothetical protein
MKGVWRAGLVVGFALLYALAARAQKAADPFDERTQVAGATAAGIDARVNDINILKQQAQKDNQQVKLSCIEEKLQRAKQNQSQAKSVMDSWQLGAANPVFSQRALDRLLLLQVYAMVYAEEARACTDAKALANGLEVKVENNVPASNGAPAAPGSAGSGGGSIVGGSNEFNFPPPRLERPPLASPF